VSCVSAAACTAVGGYEPTGGGATRTLVESWNGTRWSVVPSPNSGTPQALYGVSCVSAAACTAVGYYTGTGGITLNTLIESWNGTGWSVVPSPNPSDDSVLKGVSCVSATACTAVGFGNPGTGTLVESWNGTSWSVVPSPNPGTDNTLLSVSCASAAACTAAGYYDTNGTGIVTLIESWNGTSWTRVPSPHPGGDSELPGVSCATAAVCTAVGDRSVSGGGGKTLIESGTASG
jgi:hypothetical protein